MNLRILVFLLWLPFWGQADDPELKKIAHNLYITGQYAEAAPLYAQLISQDSTNLSYRYFYGVCLLHSGGKRSEIIRHLSAAADGPKTPVMVFFQLGKAYQLDKNFDAAISNFEKFKSLSNAFYVSELKVDDQIEMCRRAKELYLNGITSDPFHLRETDLSQFASTFNISHTKSRLIPVTAQILKGRNKEKFSRFIFIDEQGKWMSFAGPGKTSGKEIYIASRKNSSEWNEEKSLRYEKPFPFAADNPVITGNGTTVYFSCNSFNSIGGHDLYMTRFNPSSGLWTYPEQLALPINSPADDIFLIPDLPKKKAILVSNRNSAINQFGVYEIDFPLAVPNPEMLSDNKSDNKKNEPKSITEKPSIHTAESSSTNQSARNMTAADSPSPVNPNASGLPDNKKYQPATNVTLPAMLTITGYFYDAARWNDRFENLQIKIQCSQKEFNLPLLSPDSAFVITLPKENRYSISVTKGSQNMLRTEIRIATGDDSCALILVSHKTDTGYTLSRVSENEMSRTDFAVQLGAFRERNSEQLMSYFHSKGIRNVEVVSREQIQIVVTKDTFSFVDAWKVRRQFMAQGINDAFIVMRRGHEVLLPDWDLARAE